MARHRPRKHFGQHFLHDQYVIEQIIDAFNPQPGQQIIEIGPGEGALTFPLLQCHGELHVIEIDRDLANEISKQGKDLGVLHVHCHDALNFDFCQVSENHLRIIGNLPYNISTPLIFHLLECTDCITDMLFMLQKEVVERLAALPGNKQYGRLTVMVQSQCQIEKLFAVDQNAFVPAPKVNSSLVRLIPHQKPVADILDKQDFALIVKKSFAHRRKTLKNTLRDLLDEIQIKSVGINPNARAEELTLNQFAGLANLYHNNKNQ